MNTNKIYIIVGETGAHDDRCEWVVYWTDDQDRAHDYVELLTTEFNLQWDRYGDNIGWDHYAKIRDYMKQFDPYCAVDYTGTTYRVVPVDKIPTTH